MPAKRRDEPTKHCKIRSFFWAFHWIEKLILGFLVASLILFILLVIVFPSHVTIICILVQMLNLHIIFCRPTRFKPLNETLTRYYAKSIFQPFTMAENAIRHHQKCLDLISNEKPSSARHLYEVISQMHENELTQVYKRPHSTALEE